MKFLRYLVCEFKYQMKYVYFCLTEQHINELSQSLFVQVSQILFSRRCISETILDEIETLEGTLDEKKTTLMSAVNTEVSLDPKILQVLGIVLTKFKEMTSIGNSILNMYGKK